MKKRIIIIITILLLPIIFYLFMSHHLIYKKIGNAGLPTADTKGEYMIKGVDKKTGLIYSALGDSLTAGVGTEKYEESYPYLLAQKFSESYGDIDLRDRAYPGARTSGLINDLLEPAIKDQPDVITLLIGVNDIHGLVSKKQFTENYSHILKRLKNETKAKVYAISIPFIGTNSLLLPPYHTFFRHETEEYNKIIKKLANEYNIKYIDLYTPTARMFESPAMCSRDEFHPSAAGYDLWANIIYANLNH